VGEALNGSLARAGARRKSPALAVILSLLPGLGQMYNQQMVKGILILGVFMYLVRVNDLAHLYYPFAMVLYFWNLFDAYWTAKKINESGEPAADFKPREQFEKLSNVQIPEVNLSMAEEKWESSSTPGFGVFLIILGILFLLNNFGVVWLTWDRVWPAALLGLGLWMIISFALRYRTAAPAESSSQETRDEEETKDPAA
jgi:TM2 domain-containing membrane protein YozV